MHSLGTDREETSRSGARSGAKLQKLVGFQWDDSVRTTIIIAEFDLVRIRIKHFDDRADMSTPKFGLGQIFGQDNGVQKVEGTGHGDRANKRNR